MAVALSAVGIDFVMVSAQRAGDPDTRPLNLPLDVGAEAKTEAPAELVLNDRIRVFPRVGAATVRCGGLEMDVAPLLTFESRSPDRFWTLIADAGRYGGPRRQLTNWRSTAGEYQAQYRDDGVSILRLSGAPDGSILIVAHSRLEAPVYSHLNSWCSFTIHGHRELSLRFSPCPEERIAVAPFGYPVSPPLRLAYLDARGTFHVAEADQGEKGPFRELAAGSLPSAGPLIITLVDGGQEACRLVLDDWGAQAGRSLSPTAGWELPVNAIEFSRRGSAPGSTCDLSLCLASTSVGRGWDSVGHAAGTYRNRLRIEPVRQEAVGR